MSLGKGTLAKGTLAGSITPPADGLMVTVTKPQNVASSRRPTIEWTHTPQTSVQTQWQVTISQGVSTVYTTGFVMGADTSHQITDPLSAGAIYLVRVNIITDYPSSASGVASFSIQTPDLGDHVSRPFLRHTVEAIPVLRSQI